ncbi:NAD(P)-binding protein [Dichomitus squalens LYAD-421 SS1]|uniref:enoyl-[acyl-carrier-protein] reductase n=1 Tax=Dichomitus squalens TaxID=114155 RepID=A0A4Q9Q262_9APHY|nr:NAD(P)-binding protein [Dichomitus squalens LYAD-421 SS1]EJF64206.1 NAD(P)-binding protein [Dichomitus squalens LYAD-421 SS1]TBU60936.1 NAD(P)-binding protein [Dichomitus squalens]
MLRQCATRLSRPSPLRAIAIRADCFATSSARRTDRAVIYAENGNPAEVLRVKSYDPLPPPPPGSVNIRFRLSPINPSDINVVQGVYPAKPTQQHVSGEDVFIGGNEGLAEVVDVGSNVDGLHKGDWVTLGKAQFGTWASTRVISAEDVIKLPAGGFSEVNAATINVNPPTAYNMLHQFVDLKEDDWVLQNGANSAVGQAVIQIAARKGIKTINFVRSRPDLDNLICSLTQLGATHVFTYDALSDKSLAKHVKQWTSKSPIRLLLNCVSGPDTTAMTRLLGDNAHLVSYGAMSKKPLSLPTSLFIFKNLTTHGYWQHRWYQEHSRQEREKLMRTLANLKLKEPEHEILDLSGEPSDEAATKRLRDTLTKIEAGFSKKVLLRLQ